MITIDFEPPKKVGGVADGSDPDPDPDPGTSLD